MSSDSNLDTLLSQAQEGLDTRDLKRAAAALGAALLREPLDPRMGAMLDALARAHDEPLVFTVNQKGAPTPPQLALRAVLLDRAGKTADAWPLLLAVHAQAAEAQVLALAEVWLDRPGVLERIPLAAVLTAVKGLEAAPSRGGAALELIDRLRRSREASEPLTLALLRLARRAGATDRAVEMGRAAHASTPSASLASALAGALREAGQPEAALPLVQEAVQREPTQGAHRLELGEVLLELEQFAEAEAAFVEAERIAPGGEVAVPGQAIARYLGKQDARALSALQKFAARTQPGSPARRFLLRAQPPAPAPDALEVPASALVTVLRKLPVEHVLEAVRGLTTLEAPSAVEAFREGWKERHLAGEPPLVSTELKDPDPRLPRAEVQDVLWRYEREKKGLFGLKTKLLPFPRAGVPAPSPGAAQRVAAVAQAPFALALWWSRAAEWSASGVRESDLLGCQVSPPPRPPGLEPWDWRFRCQVASALGLAQLDAGWAGSRRREALRSLLLGPLDWATTAGVIAMVALIRSEPELSGEVMAECLLPLLVPPKSPLETVCLTRPLVRWALTLETLPGELRTELESIQADLTRP